MNGLAATMQAFAEALADQGKLDLLQTRLSAKAIARAGHHGLIGAARATVDGSYFRPDPEGRAMFITPVHADGEIVDIVAWFIERPATWWWLRGTATILGGDAIMRPRWDDRPVRIFATPLDWLAGGCRGAVILDWSSASALSQITMLPEIEAEPMISAKIKRAILAMRLPRFVAPAKAEGDHGRAA